MKFRTVLVALALIASVCLPSHAQKNKKKGQEKTAAVQAGKTIAAKVGKASGAPPMEFVVNSTADDQDWNAGDGVCETAPANGQCTFRAAVAEANLFGSGSTITFASPLFDTPQTINLTGEVYISNIMTINGPGANKLTLSGRDANRVVYVYGGAELTIRDLTIADGWDGKNVGAGVYISEAGAILERVHIKDCYAVVGGGIYLEMGWMTMRQSAMTGNSADQGGAMYLNGWATIALSTLSGNTAPYGGGAIYTSDSISISDSTITNNSATSGGGGGVHNDGGSMMFGNSIIAGNYSASAPHMDIHPNNIYSTQGYNLIGVTNGVVYGSNDQVGDSETPLDAKLAPLGNNGGPTPTHSLMSGSPAIDNGDSFEGADQRGLARVIDLPGYFNTILGADIGAFEVQAPSAAPVRVSGRVIDRRGRAVSGATVTFAGADGGPVRTARTNSFGYYSIPDLRIGEAYVVTVKDRSGQRFEAMAFTPTGDTDGLNFSAR